MIILHFVLVNTIISASHIKQYVSAKVWNTISLLIAGIEKVDATLGIAKGQWWVEAISEEQMEDSLIHIRSLCS